MTGSPNNPLGIVIAGAGAFGREHLARLVNRKDVSVAGVADSSAVALERVAAHYPAMERSTDPLRLLDETRPDGVIVATSASSHFEIAAHAISKGIAVLLEKPVTPSVSLAQELAALRGAFILPGHVLRFSRDHQTLAEVVRSGTIGDIIYLNSRRYRGDDHAVRYAHEDPVLTTLIHDIDLSVWLVRAPFTSVRSCRSSGTGFRSLTSATLQTDSGVCCHIRTCWTFPGGNLPPDRLEIVSERGSIERDVGVGMTLYADGRSRVLPLVPGDDQLANEQDYFLSLIREGSRPVIVTMDDAVRGLKLADAILESQRDRREMRIAAGL